MRTIQRADTENSVYVQLLLLIGTALLGLLVFLLLSLLILLAIYGMELVRDPNILIMADGQHRPAMQIILVGQSIGLFLVPALLLPLFERRKIENFYGLSKPKVIGLGMVFLIMIVSMPILEWISIMNQKMVFPEFLKGMEAWMRNKEDELMRTTILLLKMNGLGELFVNLLIIAFVPAICEEFFFRAGLQRTFLRFFNNPHVAIWLTAALFSAIHVQFYGFVPRMLLGAGFGYIYFWSGSLWYSVLGHFVNNAYAVIMAFYMQMKHLDISQTDNTPQFAWYGYLISFILTMLTFYLLKTFMFKLKRIS